ncbi:MAG: tripartite tricarboxylate transporter substrate binding protein [Betaproteobacteria bacterium]|nr:tripartite tricarboxylate transporter substrate binding protein [Betaproteobacteria bacterium]
MRVHGMRGRLMRNRLLRNLAALWLAVFSAAALAQSYPTKPMRLVLPFPPGGPTEIVARLIVQRVADKLGQAIIIDNVPGAGGTLAGNHVARSAPDGYTLLLANGSTLSSSPMLFKGASYDPLKSFAAIGTVAQFHVLLALHPSVQAESVNELVALAKSQPGKINYGSPGIGTISHLAAELFNQEMGVALVHVPYKGSSPMHVDLTTGRIQLTFDQAVAVIPQARAGKLKVLFTSRAQRYDALPNVPTARELGLNSFDFGSWAAIVTPAGVPQAVVDTWSRELLALGRDREFQAALETRGFDAYTLAPEPMRELMKAEYAKWEKVIRTGNIRVD